MSKSGERRHGARRSVPAQLSGPTGPEARQLRLCDLSAGGARCQHFHPLPVRTRCPLDLPPGLGGVRLQAQVRWSRVMALQKVVEGKWLAYYQSGLRFKWLTPEQRAGLAAALKILEAAQESADTAPPA